jgi:hypothetical protein
VVAIPPRPEDRHPRYTFSVTGRDMSADTLLAMVLQILRDAGKALSPADIRGALQAGGMAKADTDRAWSVVQRQVKAHPEICIEGSRYRWVGPQPPDVSPVEALDLLLGDGLPGPRRSALVEVVRAALSASPRQNSAEEVARRRQTQIDGVRLLAELASEVEELLANETDPPVMIRQVRAWVKRSGLSPVGRAGEATTFDRTKHQPIVGRIRDGASVIVVRPGYIWRHGSEDVLLGKAVVEE